MPMSRRLTLALATALALPAAAKAQTLQEALAQTYANNPTLQTARAQLRVVDENVPQALAGWRPTVSLSGSAGYVDGTARARQNDVSYYNHVSRNTMTLAATATLWLTLGGLWCWPGLAALLLATIIIPAIAWKVLRAWAGGQLALKTNAAIA